MHLNKSYTQFIVQNIVEKNVHRTKVAQWAPSNNRNMAAVDRTIPKYLHEKLKYQITFQNLQNFEKMS